MPAAQSPVPFSLAWKNVHVQQIDEFRSPLCVHSCFIERSKFHLSIQLVVLLSESHIHNYFRYLQMEFSEPILSYTFFYNRNCMNLKNESIYKHPNSIRSLQTQTSYI